MWLPGPLGKLGDARSFAAIAGREADDASKLSGAAANN